jgi:hypothetical protein
MTLIVILLILLLLGGGGWGWRSGNMSVGSPVFLVLVGVVLFLLFGGVLAPSAGWYHW